MFKLIKLNDLLSQKYTILIFGNIAITILNFLIVVILSNKLSLDAYGKIREIMLYAGFVFLLGSAGFSQTLYYFINKTDNQIEVLKITGAIRFLLFLSFTIILIFTIIIILVFNFNLVLSEFLIFTVYLIPLILSSVDLNLSYYYKKIKIFFIVNCIVTLLRLVLIFRFTQHEFDIIDFLLILVLSQWLAVFCSIVLLKSRYFGTLNLKSDFSLIKKQLNYALPISTSTILGFFILNTDKIMVNVTSLTKDKLAIISNISFEAPIVSIVYSSFLTIALPGMIKAFDEADFKQVLLERFGYIYKIAKLILPIVVSFIVWNQHYIALIFGANYQDYGFLFAIFSTISLLRFCSHHDIFLATNNTSYILYYQIIEFIFQVVISIILYSFFDLLGLVIASVITNYIYVFFVNLKSSKILKVKFTDILPFTFLIRRLVILFGSAIAVKHVFGYFFPYISWMIPLITWFLIVAFIEIRIIKIQNSK